MTQPRIASQQCLKWLSDAVIMRLNQAAFAGKKSKVLLVEGATDEQFIGDYLDSSTICQVSSAYGTFCRFPEVANSKLTIIQLVNSFSKFRAVCSIPPKIGNVPIWGMVDRDFDEPCALQGQNLLVTDTHDLETLILSTDDAVMSRIDGCPVPSEDTRRALFMAYQVGCTKRLLRTVLDVKCPVISRPSVSYASLFEDGDRISLAKVLQVETNEKSPGSAKFKKRVSELARDRTIRSKIGSDCCWKIGFAEFTTSRYPDLWDVVNGHDIMSILKFLNPDVAMKFTPGPNTSDFAGLDRRMEVAIIKAYDRPQFKKTKIYKQMADADLVKCG